MKIKTSELTDIALDYAAAKCEGGMGFQYDTVATYWITIKGKDHALSKGWAQSFAPSTDWSQGGPIIEREGITVIRCDDEYETDRKGYCTSNRIPVWAATTGHHSKQYDSFYQDSNAQYEITAEDCTHGTTPLIAAMRCYVASKLGGEIEIPEALMKGAANAKKS